MQNSENNKKNFRVGVFYALLGLMILAPLFYRSLDSFQNRNVVGPFFGICLGITFLFSGIVRISKSRSSHENDFDPNLTDFKDSDPDKSDKAKKPIFIKLVAFSPLIAIIIFIILGLGCEYLSFGYFLKCHSDSGLITTLGYYGILGWFVSLPIAGMLSLINSSLNS